MTEITIEKANNGYILVQEDFARIENTYTTYKTIFTEPHELVNYLSAIFDWDCEVFLEKLTKLWSAK